MNAVPPPSTAPQANVPTGPAGVRPSVIQLAIKEKAALFAAYIPLFKTGGIFVPTTRARPCEGTR